MKTKTKIKKLSLEVVYVTPKKTRNEKSRRGRSYARPEASPERGGMRTVQVKRHDRRMRKAKRENLHFLDTRRPRTRAELDRLISNEFDTRAEASRTIGVAASTLNELLSGRRNSLRAREILCKYYSLPMSVFES